MNEAQKLMVRMGVDSTVVLLAHKTPKFSKSHTKKGPGRIHKQGRDVEVEEDDA